MKESARRDEEGRTHHNFTLKVAKTWNGLRPTRGQGCSDIDFEKRMNLENNTGFSDVSAQAVAGTISRGPLQRQDDSPAVGLQPDHFGDRRRSRHARGGGANGRQDGSSRATPLSDVFLFSVCSVKDMRVFVLRGAFLLPACGAWSRSFARVCVSLTRPMLFCATSAHLNIITSCSSS